MQMEIKTLDTVEEIRKELDKVLGDIESKDRKYIIDRYLSFLDPKILLHHFSIWDGVLSSSAWKLDSSKKTLEFILTEMRAGKQNNTDLVKIYKKYYREESYDCGKVICEKRFYITGENEYQETEPEKPTDRRVYAFWNKIVNENGAVEKIVSRDENYVTTKNHKYPVSKLHDIRSIYVDKDAILMDEGGKKKIKNNLPGGQQPYKVFVCRKDNGVIQVKIYRREFYITNTHKAWSKKSYLAMLSLNTRTGRNYFFCPQKPIGSFFCDSDLRVRSLHVGDDELCGSTNGYANDYEKRYWMPEGIVNYIAELIATEKEKELGFKPSFYRNCFCPLEALVSFNANPRCNVIEYVKTNMSPYAYKKYFKNSDTACDDFLRLLGLKPTKSLRKLFFDDITKVIKYSEIMKEGYFTNPDYILMLAKSEDSVFDNAFMPLIGSKYYERIFVFGRNKTVEVKSYFKINFTNRPLFQKLESIYNQNEELIVKRLLRTDHYSVMDTFRMLKQLELQKGINFRKKSIPFSSRKEYDVWIRSMYIKDFSKKHHDEISSVFNVICTKNEKIPYSKAEKKIETKIKLKHNEFQIYLPKDTAELRNVGREMNICVGSYGTSAISKKCTIVVMKMDGVYDVCMELEENRVVQVKKYGNSMVSPDSTEYKVLYSWMEKNHLNAKNCIDFHGPEAEPVVLTDKQKITSLSKSDFDDDWENPFG